MGTPFVFPKLYPILDAGLLAVHRVSIEEFAAAMRSAGVELLQYRDKAAGPQAVLRNAALIGAAFKDTSGCLILNDRADLAVLAGWDGVHVGQEDLSPEDARLLTDRSPSHHLKHRDRQGAQGVDQGIEQWIVGVSTHAESQVRLADAGGADYVAIGPVFTTGTKLDAEPVVGLDGVRRARQLTQKPLVAIGGITRANARSVTNAGADSVAVISGLFVAGEPVENVARDFIDLLR